MSIKKLNFTDLKLLEMIQKEYADDYKNRTIKTQHEIPIDCTKIANNLGVQDEQIVFERLYFHLNKIYSDNFPFFNVAGHARDINFPKLCAVVASLEDHQKDSKVTRWIAISGVIAAIVIPLLIELVKVYFLGGSNP